MVSRKLLSDNLGLPTRSFQYVAWPYGRTCDEWDAAAARLGVSTHFVVQRGAVTRPNRHGRLPRLMADGMPLKRFAPWVRALQTKARGGSVESRLRHRAPDAQVRCLFVSQAPTPTHQVVILQRRLVQYRLTLFERLRNECAARGVDLRLVYGQASDADKARNDGGSLPWADEVEAKWFSLAGTDLLWQPFPAPLRQADLVVLTQELKILSNYPLLARRALGRGKLAYWGHGRNLQSTNPDSWRERWKALLSTKIDWWFAYTEDTVDMLVGNGYPASQITCLDNAIDDVAFRADLDAVDANTLAKLQGRIDLGPDAPLGIYCGALYKEKRVDLLIDAADRIHEAIADFRLVVIGDGPTRPELDRALAARPWAHCLGSLTGTEKAAWFRLATVQISPGAVGLHVLDSFIAGIPLITTKAALHGPEIGYVENGVKRPAERRRPRRRPDRLQHPVRRRRHRPLEQSWPVFSHGRSGAGLSRALHHGQHGYPLRRRHLPVSQHSG